ncbi:MAG: hypothetical protein M3R24_30880 [Chloroflexota bacterium]|nr:hypothetical protein [Chloroflexota bacterium]PLS82076.1 MAG: hypothetical protein CYG59_05045 [Chloroflexota bacterium]
MNAQTRSRTFGALMAVVLTVAFNTVMAGILDVYAEWFAWTIFGLTLVLVVLVLRFQQHLSVLQTTALLALPFVLAVVGALMGV